MKLDSDDLIDLARGAAFLGTGGGGDPYIGRLLAQQAIRTHGMPDLVQPDEVPDDAQVYTSAMIGAPTVLVEKLANGADLEIAIQKLEQRVGRKADFISSIEVGGCNSMIPIATAARLGVPLIDADGMGRAFPELQMTTFNVYGVSASPTSMVDEHLNSILIEAETSQLTEEYARINVGQMGLGAMISCYPMTGDELKRYCVPGTMSMALDIGRAIARGRLEGDPFSELLGTLRRNKYYGKCKLLFHGKIKDLRRETARGFATGHCKLESLEPCGKEMEILFQNENLVARIDGCTVAIVPDLICIVDSESAEPITTEGLKYGQRVKVIGASAAPVMRTRESLEVFGPRAFGIDEQFVEIEKLHDDIP